MMIKTKKFKKVINFALLFMLTFVMPTLALWGNDPKKGKFWVEKDGNLAIDGWKLIDDDSDGIGYYYYFNEDGFILTDDITPDYKIVGEDGRRVGMDGKPIAEKIENLKLEDFTETDVFSNEILDQIKAEQGGVTTVDKGHTSSGQSYRLSADKDDVGPAPSDNLTVDVNPDGSAKVLLGTGVVLKNDKEKNRRGYDVEIDKKMVTHITGGNKYTKSVNGTIFNKNKWKGVMALRGTGATIVFANPSNNFNKLKGRIATHYFTYTDRTTECTLYIINEDNGEELFSSSEFNYNGGIAFECTFPRKARAIRFELEVNGQYTSRVCYLRNCEFGFDKEAYEDELYEDEVNEEYIRRYGTDSDAEYDDEEEEQIQDGEWSLEGEDPSARYRRLNNISDDDYWLSLDYDEDDDTITEAMKASISEARKRREEEIERQNKVSGPAFDPELINATEALGPNGASRFVPAEEVSDAS